MTSPWFVVRTATRQEQRAMASLVEAEFTCYLPSETRWHRTPETKEKVSAPLFAGYLFVQCEPGDCSEILDLDGVHQFVRYVRADGVPRPMPIPAREIEKVRKAEAAGQYDLTRPSRQEQKRLERRAKGMKRGEAVSITDGPFSGFIGRVLEMRMSDRAALVEVELFGRISNVEVPVNQLDAA